MQYKKLKEQSNCKVNSLKVVERYLRELHHTGETVRVEESNTQRSHDSPVMVAGVPTKAARNGLKSQIQS